MGLELDELEHAAHLTLQEDEEGHQQLHKQPQCEGNQVDSLIADIHKQLVLDSDDDSQDSDDDSQDSDDSSSDESENETDSDEDTVSEIKPET